MRNLAFIPLLGGALALSTLMGGCEKESREQGLTPLRSATHARIVFVGDSITDGNTYPTLFRQSLMEAGYAPPVCINSGIGNDTAKGMLARLDATVFIYKPTLITLSAGVNDSRQTGVTVFEESLDAIALRCQQEKIPLVLLTPSTIRNSPLLEFHAAVLRVAAKYQLTVADVNKAFRDAPKEPEIMETDGVHPNWEGHRVMARVLLDTLGYQDVPLAPRLTLSLYPGVITSWQMRELAAPLTEETVAQLTIDEQWRMFTLPEDRPITDSWWREDERQRGYAQQMDQYIGKGPRYVGLTTVHSTKTRQVYLNTGVTLHTVWLNGVLVYSYPKNWYPGWHAGRERVQVELKKGNNTLVIETGKEWFLSITDDTNWS